MRPPRLRRDGTGGTGRATAVTTQGSGGAYVGREPGLELGVSDPKRNARNKKKELSNIMNPSRLVCAVTH